MIIRAFRFFYTNEDEKAFLREVFDVFLFIRKLKIKIKFGRSCSSVKFDFYRSRAKINRDFDRFRHVTGRIYSSSFSVGQIGDLIIKTICRKSWVFYKSNC